MLKTPLDILKKYWDYHSFRPQQEAIINSVLENKDTFVLLPTGGGKSVCYQIPSMLKEGLCLVVSPLIALMKDQVQQLKEKGISAISLDSSLNYPNLLRELDNCLYGNYKFIYISPERLESELFLTRLKNLNINCIAVDEAHCISQWGNDFRPAYKNIVNIREILPNIPIIALTGSAKPIVIENIIANLDLQEVAVFKTSFKRKNLAYMSFYTENKLEKIKQIVVKNKQSSIIYVNNRNKTQQIANYLQENGITSTFYHGGLLAKKKEVNFKLWMKNDVQVMVATNAFGMGIDKPDVKTVIHLNLPENIENYYQEAGRAGRNGDKAFGIILYHNSDIDILKRQVLQAIPSVNEVKFIYRKLCSYLRIAYQEGELETYDFNISEFSLRYKVNIHKILNTLTFLDRQAILHFKKEYKPKTNLQFLVDNYNLIQFIAKNKQYNALINHVLRKYSGGFQNKITLNLNVIATTLQISAKQIKEQLLAIEKQGIIKLQIFDADINLTLLVPREDDRTINPVAKFLKQQSQLKHKQVQAITEYVLNNTTCKEKIILQYFGEQSNTNCGVCSFCISNQIIPENKIQQVSELILEFVSDKNASITDLSLKINTSETILQTALKQLLDSNKITQEFAVFSIKKPSL